MCYTNLFTRKHKWIIKKKIWEMQCKVDISSLRLMSYKPKAESVQSNWLYHQHELRKKEKKGFSMPGTHSGRCSEEKD